ncbi:MAG: response regulator [Elusimicrobia bacterium]|nr:response regulator [Elusimicrobiota bacterium]
MIDQTPPKRVLIVDDEQDLIDPLALRLRASGHCEVAVANNGAEGLRQAERFQPDLVLVDLSMPEMDGWELCRRLRADPRTSGAQIVIMTAWVSRDLEKRVIAEGANRLLLKPFDESELMALL